MHAHLMSFSLVTVLSSHFQVRLGRGFYRGDKNQADARFRIVLPSTVTLSILDVIVPLLELKIIELCKNVPIL